jgi:hypothetical protein
MRPVGIAGYLSPVDVGLSVGIARPGRSPTAPQHDPTAGVRGCGGQTDLRAFGDTARHSLMATRPPIPAGLWGGQSPVRR